MFPLLTCIFFHALVTNSRFEAPPLLPAAHESCKCLCIIFKSGFQDFDVVVFFFFLNYVLCCRRTSLSLNFLKMFSTLWAEE